MQKDEKSVLARLVGHVRIRRKLVLLELETIVDR